MKMIAPIVIKTIPSLGRYRVIYVGYTAAMFNGFTFRNLKRIIALYV
jgi:hypothetical protein